MATPARIPQDIATYTAEQYKQAGFESKGPSKPTRLDFKHTNAVLAKLSVIPGVVAGFITIQIQGDGVPTSPLRYGSGYIPGAVGTTGSTTGVLYYDKWEDLQQAGTFSLDIDKETAVLVLANKDHEPVPVGSFLAYWPDKQEDEQYTGFFGWNP